VLRQIGLGLAVLRIRLESVADVLTLAELSRFMRNESKCLHGKVPT